MSPLLLDHVGGRRDLKAIAGIFLESGSCSLTFVKVHVLGRHPAEAPHPVGRSIKLKRARAGRLGKQCSRLVNLSGCKRFANNLELLDKVARAAPPKA